MSCISCNTQCRSCPHATNNIEVTPIYMKCNKCQSVSIGYHHHSEYTELFCNDCGVKMKLKVTE